MFVGYAVSRRKWGKTHRNRRLLRGFTMMEMMGAVAIFIIMLVRGIPSLFNLQRQLYIMEPDAKARQSYSADQLCLSILLWSNLVKSPWFFLCFALHNTDPPDPDLILAQDFHCNSPLVKYVLR